MIAVLGMSSQRPVGEFNPALQPGPHLVAFAPQRGLRVFLEMRSTSCNKPRRRRRSTGTLGPELTIHNL